jgi:hypothetical protein
MHKVLCHASTAVRDRLLNIARETSPSIFCSRAICLGDYSTASARLRIDELFVAEVTQPIITMAKCIQ